MIKIKKRYTPIRKARFVPVPRPQDHICFNNYNSLPSVAEFANSDFVDFVNLPKVKLLNVKKIGIRCEKCTKLQKVTDNVVDYAFCNLDVDGKNYFIIKLCNDVNEFFLIESNEFASKCPNALESFIKFKTEYLEALKYIEDQMIPAKLDALRDTQFFKDRILGIPDIPKSSDPTYFYQRRNFIHLFKLCLQSTICSFMTTNVDYSLLHGCAMAFYEDREPLFDGFSSEFVEAAYEKIFDALI